MSLSLYYFTGTGNSRWIARQIAERLGAKYHHPSVKAKDLFRPPV